MTQKVKIARFGAKIVVKMGEMASRCAILILV